MSALVVTFSGLVAGLVDYQLDCNGTFPRLLGPVGVTGAVVGAIAFVTGWRRSTALSESTPGQSWGTIAGFLAVLAGLACYQITRSGGCGD